MARKLRPEIQAALHRYWQSLPSAERDRILDAASRNPKREILTAGEHLARHKGGRTSKVAADPEVRAFIQQRTSLAYSKLADAALREFGRPRAPSRSSIARFCKRPRLSKITADPEVRAFIDRHLPTMDYDKLADAARREFGRPRAPSKSSIDRYWQSLPFAERDRIVAVARDAARPDRGQ